MKKKELIIYRKKDLDDLKKILVEKEKDVKDAFIKVGAGQEKNARLAKSIRRDISQILTIIREKEIITSRAEVVGLAKKEDKEKKSETKK